MAKTPAREQLNDQALELVANRFRLLADPTRLKILQTLGSDEMSVTEIVDKTGTSQANASKHLAVLLSAAVVARRKDGLSAYYRVADDSIFDLCDVVCSRLRDEAKNRHAILDRR
jgi:ArsR family transcriptional regulator